MQFPNTGPSLSWLHLPSSKERLPGNKALRVNYHKDNNDLICYQFRCIGNALLAFCFLWLGFYLYTDICNGWVVSKADMAHSVLIFLEEEVINFPPTYRYKRGGSEYISEKVKRTGVGMLCLYYFQNRVFSHDVTAAILVFQNNETAAMLVFQTNPMGVELFSYVNLFFCSNKFT